MGGGGAGWGREGTLLYLSFWYVLPQRVEFLRRFGLKSVIDFAYFGLNSGMVFVGTHERICRFNSKSVICEFELDLKKSFSWRSNPRIVNSRLADTLL